MAMRTWDRYDSCREFLEAVRSHALDARRLRGRLARMAASEGARAASLTSSHGGTGDVSGMARTDARIDLEAQWADRLADDDAHVADLRELCYGAGGHDGIAALRDPAVADAIWFRFGRCKTWADVSGIIGYGVRWCQDRTCTACEAVDFVGFERAADGVGHATED